VSIKGNDSRVTASTNVVASDVVLTPADIAGINLSVPFEGHTMLALLTQGSLLIGEADLFPRVVVGSFFTSPFRKCLEQHNGEACCHPPVGQTLKARWLTSLDHLEVDERMCKDPWTGCWHTLRMIFWS